MIRVHRGSEPQTLVAAQSTRLKQAIDAFNTHGHGSTALLRALDDGYRVAKKKLFLSQHKKCAYCERSPGFEGQPVEHFRPKKQALRGTKSKRVTDRERYWWLTWTWDDLLFACATCNGQARKGNHFPLVAGSTPLTAPPRPTKSPLPAPCFNTSAEHPLLLDPADAAIEPLDHLRWLPVDRALPRSQWAWELGAMTPEGRTTSKLLGLGDRADDVDNRYRGTVWPRFHAEVERRLAKATRTQLRAAWSKLTKELVQPSSDLTAATWSMLAELRLSTRALRAAKLPQPPRP